MNDEIKEILDNLKKTADNKILVICGSQEELDKAPKYTANFLSINDRQAKVLLDYIANLQEENKELNDDNIWWSNRFKAVERDNRDYKSRIDKAIEYIKQHIEIDSNGILTITHTFDKCNMKELFNILEGSDK